ncbi:MAG: cysteine desulfurase [Sphingobacteriales bacterium SCN 48-20]|uniref:cysteine desulfurase family protein n=1 Tax=Terrimonas ferruginea TaxID=249 RepID=UPI000869BA24|nr:cysteine desulfurase family protein [Terrimonas ferruginea]MBN8781916.1 cysteine desulfurase [Terrimonas ferruginea]ODT90241.1 MAG: cysteine desulfurase [Sphingobacteriales bacterium SCN 48-20]OJW45052.1 MAG: cysteine desulfurase [Sphingobacteriales bacterium 48-107]
MERIYFDNAATTALDPEVLEAMLPYMTTHFGNPSSIYSYGRETRLAIETARKTVARLLNAHPGEIFFTSGGTESNNTAILSAIRDLGCRHIISSPIEHHAVLHTIEHYACGENVTSSFVKLLPDGHVDLADLEEQLKEQKERCLVSLMHANNEIGNLLDIDAVGNLCKQYNAIFHSDCVQTVGHYPLDLRKTPVHFISGAGHKFHGPKGVGILYVNDNIRVKPFIFGGGQERNMRAGTENLYGIVGFAKALELAYARVEEEHSYILSLKNYMREKLIATIPNVGFNGDSEGRCLYTVLSVAFPKTEKSEMILFNLDINQICVSGGSACSSGADQGSHVIRAINNDPNKVTVRFSFSRHNTREEVDAVVSKLTELI